MPTTWWLVSDEDGDYEVEGPFENEDAVVAAAVQTLTDGKFVESADVKFQRLNINDRGVPGVESITHDVFSAYEAIEDEDEYEECTECGADMASPDDHAPDCSHHAIV